MLQCVSIEHVRHVELADHLVVLHAGIGLFAGTSSAFPSTGEGHLAMGANHRDQLTNIKGTRRSPAGPPNR